VVEMVAEKLTVMTVVARTAGRERVWRDRRQKRKNHGEEGWFSTDFGPNYLPPWSMKNHIYL
jgi:hypothetical protein